LPEKLHILTFHGIGEYKKTMEQAERNYWVTRELFSEICAFAANRTDVMITVDDGNISDYEIAMPELLKNNLKGYFFIVADRIGKYGYCDAHHIVEMMRNGMSIGLHGMYHRAWPGLSEKELDIELIDARNRIEMIIAKEIVSVSCPFGYYNRKVLKRLSDLNYETVYTSSRGTSNQNSWLKHRTSVFRSDNMEKLSLLINNYHSKKFKILKRNIKSFVRRIY
jgi:peptidoglycan/xylan/chitin deacetylase (PgdA/CDA1 family)